MEHSSGLVLGQVAVDSKTNEIPAVRALAGELDLAGRTVTLDVLHVQQQTARALLDDCAHYLVTAVKDDQPTLLDDLQHRLFADGPDHETLDKEHGRFWVKDLSDPDWDGYADLNGRRHALRIERERHAVNTGETSIAVGYVLTSLTAEEAPPAQLAAIVRNHWHIENRGEGPQGAIGGPV